MKASSNDRYEPLYREVEKKYSQEAKKNRKLTAKVEGLESRLAGLEERYKAQQEINEKLRALLFCKPTPHPRTKRPHTPKLRTAVSYVRPMPEHITEQQPLTLHACHHCSTPLGSPVSSRTRVTEDIVIRPEVVVTEWTIHRYWCRSCGKQVEATVPGVFPKARFGPNVLTMTVIAKYRWCMPYTKIRDHFALSHGLSISEGEVAHLLDSAARLVGPKWAEIVAAVKVGKKVHCDETGWYIDGERAWTHVFATDRVVLYEIADTRGKGIVTRALGPDFAGIRISDCLGNYKTLPGRHQVCWAHFTREAGENLDRRPTSWERKILAKKLDAIYVELRRVTEAQVWDESAAARTLAWCEEQVRILRTRTWLDPKSRALVKRLDDFSSALFTCLAEPGIPPDNNHAERCLRKFAVQRKISGGNRSPAHAKIHAKLMSVVETLRLEGDDFVAGLQQVLAAGMAAQLSGE